MKKISFCQVEKWLYLVQKLVLMRSFFSHFSLILVLICTILISVPIQAQSFYFGNDLSYVQEMEDCGVVYHENGAVKDPFLLYAENGHNLVRLRLWHTPTYYDSLNTGKRYSDFADVKKSIHRSKAAGMQVLLDFHLSDFWADPSRQLCPVAWLPVVDNLPVLKDSLYTYIYSTLSQLNTIGELPEMVQIGNETNKGILLSPAMNSQGFFLDWPRNATLFNAAIQAVRKVEMESGKDIKVALHIAGPADAEWLMNGFWQNGVRDFDLIGLSYYWAWHQPTTIAQTGQIIKKLRQKYPQSAVMIFETGYPWTLAWKDNASNIITSLQPDYSPASPAFQKKWLIDLSETVRANGGNGVIYWESAWQSSPCFTPWGQGSHQEHATFFDFNDNALPSGGLYWPDMTFTNTTEQNINEHSSTKQTVQIGRHVLVEIPEKWKQDSANLAVSLSNMEGKRVLFHNLGYQNPNDALYLDVNADIPAGTYVLNLYHEGAIITVRQIAIF